MRCLGKRWLKEIRNLVEEWNKSPAPEGAAAEKTVGHTASLAKVMGLPKFTTKGAQRCVRTEDITRLCVKVKTRACSD